MGLAERRAAKEFRETHYPALEAEIRQPVTNVDDVKDRADYMTKLLEKGL